MKAFIDSPLLIYLNTVTEPSAGNLYENYIDILNKHKPYTDALVLDKLLNISKKKYGTIKIIEYTVLPYTSVIELSEEKYRQATKNLLNHNHKPSDALHVEQW